MKGIVILGPTAVGKTSLSIKLAKKLKTEIISADSAQVYTGMDIGTAKVDVHEAQGIFHHMIDVVEPISKYNVGEYQKRVNIILKTFEKEGKTPILVGGTGLYINSVTNGLAELPQSEPGLREELDSRSGSELYEELERIDPCAARDIHPNNKRRVGRALEIFHLTGEKFSVISKRNIKRNNFEFIKIGLERDRNNLYERINLRVDLMVEGGLIEEVKKLYTIYGENLRRINVIGYSEIIDYFRGETTLEEAVFQIKQNSRRYAKRQFTWFKNDPDVIWFDVEKMSEEEILEKILRLIEE
ncbi:MULTISPECIES: tRNA (adenosine(37)-N6)-dimethylallyltransferase MiaA [Psychrilyobacter]|uniref:tRNA dimethylallyltransferase n=1 Tax=Psychrilyobacter piezotolerans TaxID=2293438 RepID=A0ABX9KL09_9FUSO|nr:MULTISPECIES: tRNA (adenosine(37)-N6)-dimethylallyltransferase MiaA [Psychrilyobacter]MCS5421040.1 tRNA (adenosine(37)-N6)-dimethylallyltransferase MiaA [Psychrilyobacter sp. S5]NDI76319.1 tRNA (adenosine(37)-N6)-dimethylallyltransferase MiaA [Psychrilyobacter piezotolerans]RDE65918.1 tRNA (adenosine(37)-N6)-dimethylallyltransferase MiaA [Psychrilyobacter sp. S5]REI43096.1 tRNA (adenosine(37)-N6)-dimethylallyltransferase MiaA [Psychrilyobacter piezotolerans]